jgi:peptide/nickel transport system substrate-binding protein
MVLGPIAAACSSSSKGKGATPTTSSTTVGGSTTSGTITWAPTSVTPNSVSPLSALAGDAPVLGLAYDPLFYISGNGDVKPALATSWNFEPGNSVLNVTLRSGVKFADGTPLTADMAKAHFDAFKASATQKYKLTPVASVQATGPLSLVLTLSTPNPDFVRVLADTDTPGHIVSPAGLADPSKLHTATAGAGPYMLDASQSVIGDHYVYVPNPNYWDTTRKRFTKVTVRSITDPEAALAAVQTGDVDVAAGNLQTAGAAKAAGLKILTAVGEWIGIGLLDRDGTITKALGDVRVRQALNYAVDRTAITQGIYGQYGTPTDGIATPGLGGYTTPTVAMYPYDLTKAKQLMSEAGYASGFSMPLLASSALDPNNNLVTAVADAWSKINVTVKITNDPVNWAARFSSKQFPAAIDVNGNGLIAQAQSQLLTTGTEFNPFGSQDPQIDAYYQQAVKGSPAQTEQALEQVAARVRALAWYVPISLVAGIVIAGHNAPNFTIGPHDGYPQIAEI